MRISMIFLYCLISLNQYVSLNQRKPSDQFLVFVNGERTDALRIANKYGFRLMYEVLYFQQQQYNIRVLRNSTVTFNDSKWKDMWYFNLNTTDVIPDQGFLRAWSKGYTGRGIKIAIVDNGVEINHPDLITNQITELAFNFMDGTTNPSPDSGASHGTKCAGIATAVANNGHCIVGAAYEAKFVALKMMDNIGSTSTSEAGALSYRINDIDIYTNSWGPVDRNGFHRPDSIVLQALENGINQGRNGKGSIFVWAAGNGGPDDNCNCDGYVNSIYTIAISGVGYDLYSAHYSEPCSVIMACTYGSDDLEYFVETTDLNGQCGRFTGTSTTAPMAAGILALTLQANMDLTWRDIQHLVVQTSKPHNLKGGIWKTNAAGIRYHEYYGFGLMDANALTEEARKWKGLPKFRKCSSILQTVNLNVNHLNAAEDIITSDGCNNTEKNYVEYLEHVQIHIKFSANHHKDTLLRIISPANTESQLLSGRPYDSGSGQLTWIFSSVHFWGELSKGNWTIRMSIPVNTNQGQLHAWQLHLYGTSVHPSFGPDNETEIDENGEVLQNSELDTGLSKLEIGMIIAAPVVVVIVVVCTIIICLIKCRKCKTITKKCGGAEVKPQQEKT
uniref:Proprotein convertase subtilisin/kexin type 6-like isoform X2 n=1 Tax=Crassostrea virginica TaxID=6565 RepID=A0A8B8BFU9_CRAVI|nr:proprotein convertase subtilisin/kexin type 6-like isoform X2 [Crassostrea virginica]